mgnify:CR=1 FL=1
MPAYALEKWKRPQGGLNMAEETASISMGESSNEPKGENQVGIQTWASAALFTEA